ncbi:class I SAM-dependent methyltransferase [Candidatus Uhrbacteria bacterium]|nr:class I SAM-dependent methyltransferase [Candidatus Uhrbacteria bacterium]
MNELLKPILSREPIRFENGAAIFSESESSTIKERKAPTDYGSWSRIRKSHYLFYKNQLAKINKDSIFLDIGAGDRHFRELFDQFPHYIAVDFAAYPDISIVCDLTSSWPIRDWSVDTVIASNVFEHLPDTAAALSESARILKPGGKLLIAVPFLLGVHQAPYDFVRHTHYSWKRLLEQAGFEILEINASGNLYDLHATMRDKTHPRMGMTALKFSNRILKFIEWLFSPFYMRTPKDLDLCLGYEILAIKRPI